MKHETPLPRWMEPHYRRLDMIGTVIGSALMLAIVVAVIIGFSI